MSTLNEVCGRQLDRLAETLSSLKERVRAAVAAEAASAISDAVRGLLEAALAPPGRGIRHPAYDRQSDREWRDPDGWDGGEDDEYDVGPYRGRAVVENDSQSPPVRIRSWGAALSVGVAVARWLVLRPAPAWIAAGAGAVAAAAALTGGAAAQVALAVSELLELSRRAGPPLAD